MRQRWGITGLNVCTRVGEEHQHGVKRRMLREESAEVGVVRYLLFVSGASWFKQCWLVSCVNDHRVQRFPWAGLEGILIAREKVGSVFKF